jgi:sodium/potassium-transporting ATPase subunit alpha
MLQNSCFTDCAAASVLAYEAAEADVLLRPPRNPKKDRLVNWRLFLQAYGFIGILECFSSFAMAFWYLQRKGLPFSVFWFRFGFVPDNISSADFNARLNEASSIYFINLIVM